MMKAVSMEGKSLKKSVCAVHTWSGHGQWGVQGWHYGDTDTAADLVLEGRRGGGGALVQVRKHCRLRTYNRKIFCHNLTNILKYQKRNDQLSACQVVRSVSDWSCGQDRTEYSIVASCRRWWPPSPGPNTTSSSRTSSSSPTWRPAWRARTRGTTRPWRRTSDRSSSCCCCPPSRGRLLG